MSTTKASAPMHLRALLLAGAFAFFGISSLFMYMKEVRLEASGGPRQSVIVVAREVSRNTPLTDADLATRSVPAAYVDTRMVRAQDRAKLLGIRAVRTLEPGQAVEWHDLALGTNDSVFGTRIPPGTRALTLHIPQQYMSSSLVRPGDYVDLLAVPEEQRTAKAIVLLEKVLVLASGSDTSPTQHSTRDRQIDQLLTVAVTVREAQTIALATTKGPVIALVRPLDEMGNSGGLAPAITSVTNPTPVGPKPLAPQIPKSLTPSN
jgi:pilus assembly protein CpaB